MQASRYLLLRLDTCIPSIFRNKCSQSYIHSFCFARSTTLRFTRLVQTSSTLLLQNHSAIEAPASGIQAIEVHSGADGFAMLIPAVPSGLLVTG